MASYRHIEPCLLLNQTVGSGSIIDSKALDLRTLIACGLQLKYDDGLTATFQVMGSVDGLNFDDMGYLIPAASGIAGSAIINIYGIGVNYIKLRVNRTSGSAAVTVKGSAKGA